MGYLHWVLAMLVVSSVTGFNIQIMESNSVPPLKLIAGQIHYSRIPVEYWEHRLLTIKSMGFNALSVYVMWNFHMDSKGLFDFLTDNKNIQQFLRLAKKHGFYVLLRPGPYVCAEWDFGGLPAQLLSMSDLKIRANNDRFLGQVNRYFKLLAPIIAPFMASNGGPIVLLQIENEYGFYGNDKFYIEALRQMWVNLGIKADEYYVDTVSNLEKCHWKGANIGINDGVSEDQYTFAKKLEPNGMIFGGQIYSGWLTHWGENFQGKNMSRFMQQFEFLFQKNHSFSMYMVHGGSNFGLTAGANTKDRSKQKGDYQAHITSYDYDAPINQQGSTNEKYVNFRNLAAKYVDWQIPDPPAPIPIIEIPAFKPFKIAGLFANLPTPVVSDSSVFYPFESYQLQMYNQGFAIYQTTLQQNNYNIRMVIHDFALVYLDDKFISSFNRSDAIDHRFSVLCEKQCKLRIFVEAMGHINFDHGMENDYKGLITFSAGEYQLTWNIYTIDVDKKILDWRMLSGKPFPSLSKASFNLTSVGDTYINVKNYQKGYVWVNGRNLGRYWNIGPSQKLFCPGVWLKQGQNDLYILDLLTDENGPITGDKTLV